MNKTQIAKIAAPIISALAAESKAQVKVGDAVIAAAAKLSEKDIKPFCEAVKASLENRGFTPGSIKTTLSYIRRVVTAIVVNGIEVEQGQTLRGLYESLPKKQTGGASHAPRLPNPKSADADADMSAASSAEKLKAAVTLLFGHCDAELLAAVQYAAENESIFIRWAQASAQAAQMTEAAAPAKPTTKRARKAVTA